MAGTPLVEATSVCCRALVRAWPRGGVGDTKANPDAKVLAPRSPSSGGERKCKFYQKL